MNTVYSELHERLNQMVNYSSQLIFVSSDTIAAQRKTLESFLATQDEHTDVAFITANPDLDITQYRRQLCQQLLGQVAGSFIRPLNELLESLNHHDGPVLIGIMQAQELPNEFLRELWQLVLQSRFAANKQHLNIVLFGETHWAEQAQQWLPATNTATPLLLSSETVSGATSDLDRLIAEKRAAFQRRLADRAMAQEPAEVRPVFTRSPWFALLAIGLFISIFGGLLWWQYPEKVATLLGYNTDLPEATKAPISAAQPAESEPLATTLNTATTPPQNAEVDTNEITPTPIDVEPAASVTEQLLVARWKPDEERADSSSEQPSELEETSLNSAQATTVPTVNLPANGSDLVTADSNTAIEANSTNASQLADTVLASFAWLPAELPDGFVIQLTGVSTIALAEQFIADNELSEYTWVYQAELNGNPWFVVVAKQMYPTLEQARAGISQLPTYNQVSPPFVKSVAQIKRQQITVD